MSNTVLPESIVIDDMQGNKSRYLRWDISEEHFKKFFKELGFELYKTEEIDKVYAELSKLKVSKPQDQDLIDRVSSGWLPDEEE